ncbi:MAG: restriction endonuclease subunit S, partial [Opitutales bacterium]|nr:restriction endonuclease subunit S [Opitutales bacterium]
MKAGWKTVKLEEVCAVEFGERVVRKNDAGTMYPVYGGGGATFNIDRHNRESCVVVSRFGMSERCVRFVEGKFFLNDSGLTVTSTSPEAYQGYIDLLLHAKAPEIYALGGGTAQKNLDTKNFRCLEIALPPLSEQKRIVALLDEAFVGIDEAKAKAAAIELNLKELKIGFFSQQLHPSGASLKPGWKLIKLDELVEVQNGYAFSSKDYSDSGHFLMRIGNVQNGKISTSDPKYVQLPPDGSLDRFSLVRGDILVSLTGNVGRVGVISDAHLPAALNQRVARISPRSHAPVNRDFLLHFLYSDFFREQLSDAGRGSAQQNVSTKDIVALEIALPPEVEQEQVVAVLNQSCSSIGDLAGHV